MNRDREAWIDWMKVIGMALIIIGHTGGQNLLPSFTSPFNPKQLGVVFFVFVTGYSLARSVGNPVKTVFSRYFEVGLFCLCLAVVNSVFQWFRIGDLQESNYLPLILGINVLDNGFPANPTTWYVGTYLHILVAWWLVFRKWTVSFSTLAVSLITEVVIRWAVIHSGRDFTAYMLLFNWMTVFLAGQYFGQRSLPSLDGVASHELSRHQFRASTLFLIAMLALWPVLAHRIGITNVNPFGRIPTPSPYLSELLTSLSVSYLYLAYAVPLYLIFSKFPNSSLVEFLANNTLIVFLAHMPLIYVTRPILYQAIPIDWLRLPVNLLLFFGVIAVVSHLLRRAMRAEQIKRAVVERLFDDGKSIDR
jgi:fucose 4-O-acetylase-like acetyltransferase